MKICRYFIVVAFMLALWVPMRAQQAYWVLLTDKQGSVFDPYSYFDAKAIERYRLNNADLYDISNYPVASSYAEKINAIASEEIGQSRWFNAVAVVATPDEIEQIGRLPFVRQVLAIESDMQLAEYSREESRKEIETENKLKDQLSRMQGEMFREKGIDGKGIRIAVFDAGFPKVNSHVAFRHLRDSNQIVDTWNFVKRKKDVYTGLSHGTMVLSCITGDFFDTSMLGLATGAEFLLALTETRKEPAKEEVWWTMAMEWADKNGADIINSSLGYELPRYQPTQMDGTSMVAKAANMAARKGMLVCNAAGNQATDGQWRTIVTPADADSILTVGAIDWWNNLPCTFTSRGPTADGRLKPNVAACGYADVADPDDDTLVIDKSGTSFATPLVAGFCACAWQMNRNMTAMQLKAAIEQSADLYPYYDYALGYGVPQASHFVKPTEKKPSFHFVETDSTLEMRPLVRETEFDIYYKLQHPNGQIIEYAGREGNANEDSLHDTTWFFSIYKKAVEGGVFHFCYLGYSDSIRVSTNDTCKKNYPTIRSRVKEKGMDVSEYLEARMDNLFFVVIMSLEPEAGVKFIYGDYGEDSNSLAIIQPSKFQRGGYFAFGTMIPSGNEIVTNLYSPTLRVGGTFRWNLGKFYAIGVGYNYGMANFRFNSKERNVIDNTIYAEENPVDIDYATLRRLRYWEIGAEVFQRIYLDNLHNGWWDLGAYVEGGGYRYRVKYMDNPAMADYDGSLHTFINPTFLDGQRYNWGVFTRLCRTPFGLYARYRLSRMNEANPLPRLEVGINLPIY